MKEHYVYIARCIDDTLYTGYTTDLEARETRHNEGRGARYTRTRRPIEIIYSETFETRSAALKREYEIKQMKKEEKEHLVSIPIE